MVEIKEEVINDNDNSCCSIGDLALLGNRTGLSKKR